MKLFHFLESKKETWFIIFFGFLFFLLRLPSIFEPNWYGDEGIYEVIGFGLRHGRILYKTIWDNKPPILYWIYAIFNGNQASVKTFSLIFGLFAFFIFLFLVKKIFRPKNNTIYFISSTLFILLFATPILEGNIANAENFMLFPIILSALIVYSYLDKNKLTTNLKEQINNYKPLILAGLLLGFAFLIKVVAIFDFATLFLFLFFIQYENIKKIRSLIYELIYFSLSFFIPLFLICVYFLIRGTFFDFIKGAFLSNISYVNYGNQLIIPQGFLILKLVLLISFIFFLFLKRITISKTETFIFLWFAFSLFNAFFSQRPYTHYLLILISPSILLICLILKTKLNKKFISLIFTLSIIIVLYNFGYSFNGLIKSTFGYYENFIQFEIGVKNLDNYISFFDPNALRDFKVAQFINLQKIKNNSVFIWGNDAQLYKLTNTLPQSKFIVLYHLEINSQNLNQAKIAFAKTKPNFVVIVESNPKFNFLIPEYKEKIIIDQTYIYEKSL